MSEKKYFVRCMKSTGAVVGQSFEPRPQNLPHTIVFWVEVSEGDEFPAPRSHSDQVSFKLKKALKKSELKQTNLVISQSDGRWAHSETPKKAAEVNKKQQLDLIDAETYRLIKQWCQEQPEKCEEAFINIGISEDKSHPRYQAYVKAKSNIIKEQKKKRNVK